jgi:hypothetical protein
MRTWIAIAVGAAAACTAYAVISSWPEVVRYRRIRAM